MGEVALEVSRRVRLRHTHPDGSFAGLGRRESVVMSVAVAAAAGANATFETSILPGLPEPPLDNFNLGEAALSEGLLSDPAPDGTFGLAARAAAVVLGSIGGSGHARDKSLVSGSAVAGGGAGAAMDCAKAPRAGSLLCRYE